MVAQELVRRGLIAMLQNCLESRGLGAMKVIGVSASYQTALVLYRGRTVALPCVVVVGDR